MYKLAYFVPEADVEVVNTAVFATGAGCIGQYDQCCFQTVGQGQFRPLAEANPHIGAVGELERDTEVRLEMVCDDDVIREAIAALKTAHPYEEPAWEAWRLETF